MQTRYPFLTVGALGAFLLTFNAATPPLLAQDNPVISEFKAVNTGPLKDEDGQFSDWIEIYNPGAHAISLADWCLTDAAGNLTKWRFPAGVTLQPFSFLTVFASGNNRTNPAANLHTSFKLDAAGEYLALVKPDGTNIVSEYTPRYPAQNPFSSYGLGMLLSPRTTLIGPIAQARIFVPTNDLGSAWTGLTFNDSSWPLDVSAIGYDVGTNYGSAILYDISGPMQNVNASVYERLPFDVTDPSTIQDLKLRMRYDDGFIAYLNGTEVARFNAPTNAAWNSTARGLHGSEPGTAGRTQADFDTVTNAYFAAQQGVAPGPAIQAADAGSTGKFIRMIYDGVNSQFNSIAFDQAAPGTFPLITADFDFRVASPTTDPADGWAFMLIPTSTYGTTGGGINIAGVGIEEPNFPNIFAVGFDVYPHASQNDVSAHWNGQEYLNATIPRGIIELVSGTFHHCHIVLEYVEGGAKVSVYLTPNKTGAPITAFENLFIAGMPQYSCRVQMVARTGGLDMNVDFDNIDVVFGYPTGLVPAEEFDLSRYIGALLPGPNVLAIQGLNASATSPDFLLIPELYARSITLQTNAQMYFDLQTPAALNASGNAAAVPEVAFSVPSGVYASNSLTVALSSPMPSAVIYYTLDGNLPTESSFLYTNALNISTSALVTARAYATNYLPSVPAARSYSMIDSAATLFSSELPILIIDTLGVPITQDMNPKANTIVTIIDAKPPASRASFTVKPDYQGLAGVEGRGQTSWGFSKRPLNIEFRDVYGRDKKVEFLDYPAGADFALISMWDDKSFLNDFLAHDLFERMGHYAVRRRFVEVFYNGTMNGQAADISGRVGNNDNVGIYLLVEKIRIGQNRVNISEPESGDPGDPITGGFIWKKDKDSPGDANFTTSSGEVLKFHDPRPENLTTNQRTWLINHINEFESVLYGANWRDPINGYAKYISVDAFVDTHWIVEFAKQIDGYRLSNYMHKDRGGKIEMNPIWDWNLSFGNANYLNGGLTNGWYWPLLSSVDHIWLRRLISDPDFNQRIVDRWGELSTSGPFNLTNLLARVDQLAAYLNEAVARDVTRWPRMGGYLWPNPDGPNLVPTGTDGTTALWDVNYATIGSFAAMIPEMKKYITGRYNWISQQHLKPPTLSRYSGSDTAPLNMSAAAPTNAIIYYTTDGSDPRLVGGAVSPKAVIYTNTITPPVNARIFARTWYTNAWSPPSKADFAYTPPKLAVTEIMYHPTPSPGFNDATNFEFIELMNTTTGTIDLGGVRVAGGVDYTFPFGPLQNAGADTTNDFDAAGTTYTLSKLGLDPAASVTAGGPAGSFVRLVNQGSTTNRNRLTFDQTANGPYDKVTAEFDFRGQNVTAAQVSGPPTFQNFDSTGSVYQLWSFDTTTPSTPAIMPAEVGSSGNYVRMTTTVANENGGLYFDATADRAYNVVVVSFDFRCAGAADGFGFALLNTANYSTTGATVAFSEEPNLAATIGVGFDIYLNTQSANEPNANHVSLHYNNAQVTAAVTPTLSLTANKFHRAQIVIQFTGSQALVTVKISPDVNGAGGPTETLYNNFAITAPAYRGRIAFCGRTGGANANQDIDNVNVQYMDSLPAAAGGLSMLLLPTTVFGTSGPGTGLTNFTDVPSANYVFALNLDMHKENAINDANVYWKGQQVGNLSIPTGTLDLDNGNFHHAKLELTRSTEGTLANLTLTPNSLGGGGTPLVVYSNLLLTGYYPGDVRVEFAGRNGGQNLNVDLENVRVHYETNSFNALAPGQRILLVKNRAAFESRYGAGLPIAGEFTGQLNNAGDHLVIYGRFGEPILDFAYKDGWQPLSDGYGFSLVARDPTAPGNLWSDSGNWQLSTSVGGSPGLEEAAPPVLVPVVVNEVLALSQAVGPLQDTIELYNPTTNLADISYWYLSDDFNDPYKYKFPPDTTIQPGGYLVVYESAFNSGALGSFGLKASGDDVYLFSANVAGQLTGYYHGFDFGPAEPNVSFGRHVISTGADHLVAQTANTINGANAGPKVGPVVISEIMYRPPDYTGGVDNQDAEYIELRNITDQPVWLFDPLHPTNTWHLRDGVDFQFPAGVIIPPQGHLLVVSFDPATDSARLDAFRAKYGLGSTLPILGPYTGKLDNSNDSVELAKPGEPEAATGDFNYILVDKVRYTDNSPWPLAADGLGYSLQRIDVNQYGNDPANWAAAAPTPARANAMGTAPVITTQPTDLMVYVASPVTFTVGATGAGPLRYQWRFNGNSLANATNAVLTLPSAQLAQGGTYQAVVLGPGGAVDSQVARLEVFQAVTILTQPAANAIVAVGNNTNLVVSATGNGPVTYRWLFQGADVSGATNATLTLTNLQLSQSGEYTAVISDGIASIASQPAVLWVATAPSSPLPALVPQLVTVGDTLSIIGVVTNGTPPFAYKWRKTGTDLMPFGAGTTNLVITNVSLNDGGLYSFGVSNVLKPAGVFSFGLSSMMVVQPPPKSLTTYVGGSVVLAAAANLVGNFRGQWQFGGSNLVGQTGTSLVLSNVQSSQAGVYTLLVTNSANANANTSYNCTLTVLDQPIAPVITDQPTNVLTTLGANAQFKATVTGTELLSYRWWFKQTNMLTTATNTTLVVSNITQAQVGDYQIVASNSAGVVTSDVATLSVFQPPAIASQPIGTQTVAGASVTLSVVATGADPLSYQWWFGRYQPLTGATGSNLTFNPVSPFDAGSYSVVVSNPYGQVTSVLAAVSVQTPPQMLLQPRGQTLVPGSTIQLYVVADGQAPLNYQWWYNGNPLAGETASVLTLANVQTNAAGDYLVVVANTVGSATSAVASLAYGVTNPDTDNDGIPDDWERAHGLVVGVNDANLDADGDGLSNLQEYLAGTDPQIATSVLKVEGIANAGGNATLQFLAVSNRVYAVEFRGSVTPGNWDTLTNLPPQPTNRTVIITDPQPPVTNRFYRIVIPVPQ